MSIKRARLIYGATYMAETINMDLFWLVRMQFPDPHFLLEFEHENGRWERFLLVGSLEFTRAKLEAKNCTVLNAESYFKKIGERAWSPVIKYLLKERGMRTLEVHPLTPIEVVEHLRKAGILIRAGALPWFENRIVKTRGEIGSILKVQSHMEEVLGLVYERLRRASILRGFIFEKGKALTSEEIRSFIEFELFKRGCASYDTIVSSGFQSAIPHHVGEGQLRAHTSIIFDIYPYSRKTGYFSDMTRTFVKGEPLPFFIKMYTAVLEEQELGISMVQAGRDGRDIHTAIEKRFAENGFKTDLAKDRGFIHGTGHGLGLLCHEPPARINEQSYILSEGLVVSVEPGLYYPEKKLGVRIEDLVQVTKTGCQNLTKYPKQLKDIIIQ